MQQLRNLRSKLILLCLITACDQSDVSPKEEAQFPHLKEIAVPEIMLKDRIESLTKLNDGRIFITQAHYGGALATHHNTAHIFDPSDNSFTQVASMKNFRQTYPVEVLPDGKVMVIGGFKKGSEYFTTTEVYDPAKDTWTFGPESPVELWDASFASTAEYIFTNSATFNKLTETWSLAPVYRKNTVITLMKDGNILYTGGGYQSGVITSSRYIILDPATHTSVESGDMNQKYYNHSTVVLDDGRVMVGGGNRDVHIDANPHVEIYDPQTKTWTVDESQALFEASGCLILQPNGKVIAVDDLFRNYFLYDADAKTWTENENLFPTMDHCPLAITLNDETMLLFTRERDGEGTKTNSYHAYIYSVL